MTEILIALFIGVAFGIALHKAGLTHYATITDIYRFADWTVLEFMLTALVVAAPLIQGAVDLGLMETPAAPETRLLANALGGVVFGVGMALAGYCPGTIVAEVGEGRLDALVGGSTGLFVGAIAFGLAYPLVVPTLGRIGALGHVTIASLTGASPWLVIVIFGEIVICVLMAIRSSSVRGPATNPT